MRLTLSFAIYLPIDFTVCMYLHTCRKMASPQVRAAEYGVTTGWSRLGSESELESVKFCRLRCRTGVAAHILSAGDNFGQTVTDPTKTLEYRKKMKVLTSTGVKLKRNFAIALCSINDFR